MPFPDLLAACVAQESLLALQATVPVSVLVKWRELLDHYWFDGDYNNDGVIEVCEQIDSIVKEASG